jgi:hypothetical protein
MARKKALVARVSMATVKNVPGCAVKFAAFVHNHGDRAGEQADASSQDMQDQEREPHCPSLSPSTHAG